MRRIIVALNEPERIGDFITWAKHVATCIADETLFVSPTLPLAVLEADIQALDAAQVATVWSRAPRFTAERDAKRTAVRGDLETLRVYVQGLANAAPYEVGLEIVALSGLSVKKSSGHGKPSFEAKQGPVSGSVHIVARAERTRAWYGWQYSLDGTTWTSADDTVQADQWLYGLTRGARYFFRYRSRTAAGLGDWSDVVSLLVL